MGKGSESRRIVRHRQAPRGSEYRMGRIREPPRASSLCWRHDPPAATQPSLQRCSAHARGCAVASAHSIPTTAHAQRTTRLCVISAQP
eukprot:scaffold9255_cov140-Isochrysis_galbana.AAC.3